MSKTCLVLGKTGVGKSSFINGISDGAANCFVNDSKKAVTIELNAVQFNKNEIYYKFIDTPGLQDAKGDTPNINEIQKAASEYPDFVYIIIILNFQEDRIDASILKTLETYMKIFPIQYFWEHVLLVYSNVYPKGTGKNAPQKLKEKVKRTKGEFVRAIKNEQDFNDFRTFMHNNNINFPDHIEEYFVNSEKDISDIDDDTKDQYDEILDKIKEGRPVFRKIEHDDRENKVITNGKLNKIQTLRKITYFPRIGGTISLPEFVLPPEKDEINIPPFDSRFVEENTYEVVSKKCKKYYKYKVYKIDRYKVNGGIIEGNKCYYNDKLVPK